MLEHKAIGPREDGGYLVVYETPGCNVLTVACPCRTKGQAESEADRLNQLQSHKERELRIERDLCGVDFGGEHGR